MHKPPNVCVSKYFHPPFTKKTNFYGFSRKSGKFELELHDSLLIFFWKNTYKVHKYLFHHISSNIFSRFNTYIRRIMSAVLTTFWMHHNGILVIKFCFIIFLKKNI
jgi:hypothetical protein